MTRRDPRLAELFIAALDVEPAQRDAWLAHACGGDEELARELRELLQQQPADDDELDTAATALRELADRTWLMPLPAGRRIGGFVVHEQLAAGGMGTVYVAEQLAPHRRVALKVLSTHVDGGELARRFRHESAILAHLRHPGIAQVYETGVSEVDGRSVPWFALEYVDGAQWITDHARERGLDVGARVGLFRQACDAVHHGHCKGIVHRDLKPANLLVDADGHVKVIDFGVAKILGGTAGDAAATLAGQVVGTLGYMSPEQAIGDPGAIDTRSDVYSLGVVLYELLTGRLPYEVRRDNLAALARTVAELAPDQRPLLSLPTDLRTIVLTALAKDPALRYGSVEALAQDLDRCQRNEPIAARSPSTFYVLSRFVRRNRLFAATAAALVLALALGGFGTVRNLLRAERAKADAEWERAFLVAMLYDADPWQGQGPKATVGDIVRTAVARLESTPPTPAIEADLRAVFGEVLARLGEPKAAAEQLQRAVQMLRQQREQAPGRADLLELGLVVCFVDAGRLDEAEALAASLQQRFRGRCGPGSTEWLRLENGIGRLRAARGDDAAAAAGLQAALAAAATAGDVDAAQLETVRGNAAMALRALGRFGDAETMLRQVVAFRSSAFGERHPETLSARGNLATVLIERGELTAARSELAATHAGQLATFGEDDVRTLATEHNLAMTERQLGNVAEAERMSRRVLLARRRLLGGDATETLVTQANLAILLSHRAVRDLEQQRELLTEAEQLLRDVIWRRERCETTPSADRARAHAVLGGLLLGTARPGEGEREFRAAHQIAETTIAEARPEPWVYRAGVAAARAAQGQREGVADELELCRQALQQRVGEQNEYYQNVLVWCRRFGGR